MSSIQHTQGNKGLFFQDLLLEKGEKPHRQTMSMTDTLARSKFSAIGPDGKEYKTYTNPNEMLLGGSDGGCCYSFCSWRDKRNDGAFACIGQTVCSIPAAIICVITCGNVCSPCFLPLCGRCCEESRHANSPSRREMTEVVTREVVR